MNDLGALGEAEALAAAVDLSGCRVLLDVGCGSGIYALALCRHHPRLQAILVDRDPVLRTTERLVAASGLGDRIRLQAGDMTAGRVETRADAVLLSDSLYFDRATSIRVLGSVHATLNPGGLVILRGYYPDAGGSGSLFGALFRLNLLVFDPQRSPPTADEIAGYVADAGFRDVRRFALTDRSTCFVGTK
jgi:SAM-dependent methyltransferase